MAGHLWCCWCPLLQYEQLPSDVWARHLAKGLELSVRSSAAGRFQQAGACKAIGYMLDNDNK